MEGPEGESVSKMNRKKWWKCFVQDFFQLANLIAAVLVRWAGCGSFYGAPLVTLDNKKNNAWPRDNNMWTENVVVRDIQTYLRRSDADSRAAEQSYIAGTSTTNQRIESGREELDEIKAVWNSHRIRPTRNHNVPSGIPDVMYTVPQLWGSENLIVPQNHLDVCKEACKFLSVVLCDEDILDLCNMIMSEMNLTFPKNILQAQEFYLTIQEALHSLILN